MRFIDHRAIPIIYKAHLCLIRKETKRPGIRNEYFVNKLYENEEIFMESKNK